jgi:hypothetical protein
MSRRGFLLVAFLVLGISWAPGAGAIPPIVGHSCDPDAIYKGQDVGFGARFDFPGGADDGVLVDDLSRAAAFLDYQRSYTTGHGHHRQVVYVYEVYGTLGDLCD